MWLQKEFQSWYDDFTCSFNWMCFLPCDSGRKNKSGVSAKAKEYESEQGIKEKNELATDESYTTYICV